LRKSKRAFQRPSYFKQPHGYNGCNTGTAEQEKRQKHAAAALSLEPCAVRQQRDYNPEERKNEGECERLKQATKVTPVDVGSRCVQKSRNSFYSNAIGPGSYKERHFLRIKQSGKSRLPESA
jgi:hypothetical protein